jgi:3D (Asp-Asp-Asp) domain-containing protein
MLAITAIRPFNAADTFAAERESHRITVMDDGADTGREGAVPHVTTARTVGSFLDEVGIELHHLDIMTPHYRRRIEDRVAIQITRAFYISFEVDGEREQMKVRPGTTSGEVLQAVQSEMETALVFSGTLDEVLGNEAILSFYTWRSETESTMDLIPYGREYVSTPSLSIGVEHVRQEGVVGEFHTHYIVVFIGNEEYAREIVEEITIDPVPMIIDRGVGGDLGTLTDTNCPSFHYVRRVTMNASAYTAGFTCTGKHPWHPLYGITASGRRVEHGIVAVDPRVIPLGTRLYVENYGFALAADTGSAIRGYKIDLFMYDLTDARRFGRRDITVWILD